MEVRAVTRLLWEPCRFEVVLAPYPLEKEMDTHFNILAWEIPWTEEPGGLQSMGLQRVRLN